MSSISLRPLTLLDTSNIVRWRNQPEVYKYLYSQELITEEQHLGYYHKYIETGLVRQFIIEAIIDDETVDIGTVFLKGIDLVSKKAEYGLFIGELQARGKGYASEVAKFALRIAFEEMMLNRVYLTVFSDNAPAIRSYKKAGFVIEGTLREEYYDGTRYRDVVVMAILKEEWISR